MGCGTVSVDLEQNEFRSNEKLHRGNAKKNDKLEMYILYLFGVNEKDNHTIFSFNTENKQFKLEKIPDLMKVGNYCSALYMSPKLIYLSGGHIPYSGEIMNEFYSYNPLDETFEIFSPMEKARYAHSSIFVNAKLYVMGGRTLGSEDDGILDHVERFNFLTKKWETIMKMCKRRCSCRLIIIYNNLKRRKKRIEN